MPPISAFATAVLRGEDYPDRLPRRRRTRHRSPEQEHRLDRPQGSKRARDNESGSREKHWRLTNTTLADMCVSHPLLFSLLNSAWITTRAAVLVTTASACGVNTRAAEQRSLHAQAVRIAGLVTTALVHMASISGSDTLHFSSFVCPPSVFALPADTTLLHARSPPFFFPLVLAFPVSFPPSSPPAPPLPQSPHPLSSSRPALSPSSLASLTAIRPPISLLLASLRLFRQKSGAEWASNALTLASNRAPFSVLQRTYDSGLALRCDRIRQDSRPDRRSSSCHLSLLFPRNNHLDLFSLTSRSRCPDSRILILLPIMVLLLVDDLRFGTTVELSSSTAIVSHTDKRSAISFGLRLSLTALRFPLSSPYISRYPVSAPNFISEGFHPTTSNPVYIAASM
ncbi:hypothetical protein C8R45DRAFT_1086433 [Mycena sanguinolenta]|nr:hypothetical protein C8R45DRAFT_1086433 [Mycena sanguinolenta]